MLLHSCTVYVTHTHDRSTADDEGLPDYSSCLLLDMLDKLSYQPFFSIISTRSESRTSCTCTHICPRHHNERVTNPHTNPQPLPGL